MSEAKRRTYAYEAAFGIAGLHAKRERSLWLTLLYKSGNYHEILLAVNRVLDYHRADLKFIFHKHTEHRAELLRFQAYFMGCVGRTSEGVQKLQEGIRLLASTESYDSLKVSSWMIELEDWLIEVAENNAAAQVRVDRLARQRQRLERALIETRQAV